GALAHVRHQAADLHGLLGHEQSDGPVALEGPRFQRSSRHRVGRLGLGAGDDCVHVAGGLRDGCDRITPHFFSRRSHLHLRAQRDDPDDQSSAGLDRRHVAPGGWRSARDAGLVGCNASLFHDRATLDGILDHLRAYECRLFRGWVRFRLHSHSRFSPKYRRISPNTARAALRGESRLRDPALPDYLFFATARRTTRRRRADTRSTINFRILEWNRQNSAKKRERYGHAFPAFDRSIGILSATDVLSLHRIPESDFSDHGLCLPDVWGSRTGIARAGWKTGRDQFSSHHRARAVG